MCTKIACGEGPNKNTGRQKVDKETKGKVNQDCSVYNGDDVAYCDKKPAAY